MVVKVFDAYIEGEKKATGTIDEIADYFDISRSSISLWIKNGKDPKKANPKYKHAILNKEKTKELMEQKKRRTQTSRFCLWLLWQRGIHNDRNCSRNFPIFKY